MRRVVSISDSRPSFCLLSALLLLSTQFVSPCPSDCACKWKGGKQSVECVNRGLRTFPGPIDAGTQVLDLSGNSFETLPSDHFMRLSLINLQKIYLSRCRLSHINSRAFRGLSNLVDLDLTNNELREIPTAAFPDCQGLMRLILSGNPIPQIGRNAFSSLESLTSLEMSHCGTEIIEKGAFEGLLSLEWLKLDGNKLKRLEGLESLPLSLKGIYLEENPWECDCLLLPLRLWLGERKVGNSIEPRCATPNRLTNSTLRELSIDNFACTPQLSPTTMYQKIGEGKNVSLLCKVTSIPESTLEWWFNGQLVTNNSLNLLVETTSSFPSGPGPGTAPRGVALSERKSELLILNATADENGTFLCKARNPAGIALANFTLRVLSSVDPESYPETVTSLAGSYPNLFLIAASTVAVIGAVIVIFALTLCICKCSRLCRMDSRRSREGTSSTGARSKRGTSGSSRDDNGKAHHGGSGGLKMERHPSETSTLTTHTKSNGSVFLLSTSSDLGDSNPDLIEGVNKRVEADGHETSFSHLGNGGAYPSSEPHPSNHLQGGGGPDHHRYSPSIYPMDYGLPKAMNPSTLVRRSPSYPLNTLPPSYDLAKYPKEYINPTPHSTATAYMYGGPSGPILYTTSGDDYHTSTAYPAYIIPHPGTYVYHDMGSSEPSYVTLGGYIESIPSGSGSCSCGPILEGNEEAEQQQEPPTMATVATATTAVTVPATTVPKARESPAHPATNSKGETMTVKARLQRQLTTQINESPDEGYEDESAEGTEI